MPRPKLIRITTVPMSLDKLLEGQLRFMQQHYEVTAISSDKEGLENVGKKEGVATHWVPMTRQITPVQDLKALWQLYKYFKKEKPLIVHTHTPKAGTVGMLAAKLAGVPHRLHTVAGLPLLEATGAKRKLLDIVEKATYACATKVYPNSFGLHDIILEQKYCKAEKLKVIGKGSSNGIDTAYFDPEQVTPATKTALRAELGIGVEDIVYVFVGRLVTDKGINELVDCFASLRSARNDVGGIKLLLVGPLEEALDPLLPKTIEEIDRNKNIITVGYQQDVRPYLAISDVLVFPSYREGFPNVVMQAGAMGLPSIVTDINGCNEIIAHGINGLIVPPKDKDALLEAMEQLRTQPQLYSKLRANTREIIVSRYERQQVWEALLSEYRQLLER